MVMLNTAKLKRSKKLYEVQNLENKILRKLYALRYVGRKGF